MTSDTNDTSFGKYLKKLRIEKGFDLRAISAETRISMKVLTQIEEENLDELPNHTVVRGFLKSYAAAVGADRDLVVKHFMSVVRDEKITPPGNFINVNGKKRSITLIFLVLIVCIAFLSFFLVTNKEDKPLKETPQPSVAEKKETEPEQELVEEPEKQIPEKQRLSITTVEETWLKIIIDDQPPKEYALAPGDQLELEASLGFNILIGNAGGVNLTLNDEPVSVSGKSGQAVNIQLP